MPKQYPEEAIEEARRLYCKYGGRNHELIERDMAKAGYVGWKRSILYDKGKNENARMGWITRHGFDRSLRIYTEKLTEKVNNDEQDLYISIRDIRKSFAKAVESGVATKDEVYQYRDFCKLEIEARKNLDLSRDNLETFVAGYEKLLMWAADLDKTLAKLLVKHGDRLAELAKAHYGKTETDDDGTGFREDESGEQPFSLLT